MTFSLIALNAVLAIAVFAAMIVHLTRGIRADGRHAHAMRHRRGPVRLGLVERPRERDERQAA